MKQISENYNLLEERWIPVLRTDGKPGRVGIRKALAQAGRIRQFAASNPMDNVALLRFLLAVLHWCRGNPPSGGMANSGHSFPIDGFEKLDEYKDCFNLLGQGNRFYQYRQPDRVRDEKLAANYLIHEIPTGTNKWHFRHATDKVDGLCPACCAMGLLRLPLFATSGGRGKPPGVNAKPPIYAIPTGPSLADTLLLSWRQVSDLGTPAWEKPHQLLPRSGVVPFLLGLSWLPRRVWLDDPGLPESRCISCGSRDRLIRQCVFAGIGSTKTEGSGPVRAWRDPHVLYGYTKKGDLTPLHASDVLGASNASGQWTQIVAGLVSDQGALDNRSSTWVVGFATVKNDKYLEATEQVIPAPCTPNEIAQSLEKLDRWRKEGARLGAKLRPPYEKIYSRKHIEIPPILASIRPHVENSVGAKACELLAGGDDAWERAALEYRPMMSVIARSLSPGFTTAAVQRRNQIALATPDMRPTKQADDKPQRKKGGDK